MLLTEFSYKHFRLYYFVPLLQQKIVKKNPVKFEEENNLFSWNESTVVCER